MRDPIKDIAAEIDDPALLLSAWADAHEEAGQADVAFGLRFLAAAGRWPSRTAGRPQVWWWNVGSKPYRQGWKPPGTSFRNLLPRDDWRRCHVHGPVSLEEHVGGRYATASAALVAAARYVAELEKRLATAPPAKTKSKESR